MDVEYIEGETLSRSDSFFGKTTSAIGFLEKYEVKGEECLECGHVEHVKLQKIGDVHGFDDYSLFRHHLVNGDYADEFLQATEWSSGPMFFIGLRVCDGKEFIWLDEEIGDML